MNNKVYALSLYSFDSSEFILTHEMFNKILSKGKEKQSYVIHFNNVSFSSVT